MDRRATLLIIAAWVLAPVIALGTTAAYVMQSGVVTPTHVATWTTTGVIQDAGTSVNSSATTFGLTASGGTPFCITTAKAPTPRVQFCMGVSTSAASFFINSYNGASAVPMQIVINGVVYQFPSGNPGLGAFRQITTGSTDTATSLDGTIAWDSATTSNKAQALYTCGSAGKGNILNIKDEALTAGTYPIIVTPFTAETIDGLDVYALAFNGQSLSLQCNGGGNWIVL